MPGLFASIPNVIVVIYCYQLLILVGKVFHRSRVTIVLVVVMESRGELSQYNIQHTTIGVVEGIESENARFFHSNSV